MWEVEMKPILTASAVLICSAFALADDEGPPRPSAPVSLVEAAKIITAMQAWGCLGGKMEQSKDDDGEFVYEVEGATCKDGLYDFTLDKNFKVVGMSAH
jgi:hypothetical protein